MVHLPQWRWKRVLPLKFSRRSVQNTRKRSIVILKTALYWNIAVKNLVFRKRKRKRRRRKERKTIKMMLMISTIQTPTPTPTPIPILIPTLIQITILKVTPILIPTSILIQEQIPTPNHHRVKTSIKETEYSRHKELLVVGPFPQSFQKMRTWAVMKHNITPRVDSNSCTNQGVLFQVPKIP